MQDTASRRINMVNSQILTNKVTDDRVTGAMLAVAREAFVPRALRGVAYVDEDIEVAPGRYLMEPMVFARLLQAAAIGPDDVVLDIACGTGYSTAVLAGLAGTVVGLEDNEDLAGTTNARLSELEIDNALVVTGDLTAGYPQQAPYNAIVVNGGVERVPDALTGQLADGGRLIAVERAGPAGRAVLYVRQNGLVGRRELFDAMLPVLPAFKVDAGFSF